MPSAPSTLAISCGSQITVVTPCGSTQRSNSSGVTSEEFDVQVRVDEAGHGEAARRPSITPRAVVVSRRCRPGLPERVLPYGR